MINQYLMDIACSIILAQEEVCPVSLKGMSLEDLGAMDLNDDDRERVDTIKADKEFARTGRTPKEFDRRKHEEGAWVIKDDKHGLYLRDGRHRLEAARELGLDQLWGRVQDAETAEILYNGYIPI